MKDEFNRMDLKSNLRSTQPLHTALRLHRSNNRVYFIVKHLGGRHREAVDEDSHGHSAGVFSDCGAADNRRRRFGSAADAGAGIFFLIESFISNSYGV